MFLKRIDIHGFKTYADKTRLEFKPGVTAIVGPNGCGKSNIVDAIRWVLGETSARSLRGDVMDDVIFSGSEERKPLGFAEVGITIVNDDNLLPIEYSEVEVKRRLYRSGESEFLVNKNNVRLKDIHDLFADTGIGKTAYSIMEQGNIDLILSNKPEERMIIFEEAAGITRYKNRIRDSYKKMAAADENLVRLNLVINEVEKEYKNLEKQAQKAVLYKSLRKEEIDLETVYNYTRVQELKKTLLSNNDRREKLVTELKTLDDRIEKINGTIQSSIDRVRELESRISDVTTKIYRQEAELETVGLRITHITERIQETDTEIEKNQRLVEQSGRRRDALVKQLEEIGKQTEEIESTLRSQEEKFYGYTEEIKKLDDLLESLTKESVENDDKINAMETELVKLRKELRSVINKFLEEIDTARANLVKEENRKNELQSAITDGFQKLQSLLRRHETKLNDLAYASGRSSLDSIANSLNDETGHIQKLVQELKSDVDSVHKIYEGISRVLFGKGSQHEKKQLIEDSIEEVLSGVESLRQENVRIQERLKSNREKKEQFREIASSIGLDRARNREKLNHLSESGHQIKGEIERVEEMLHDIGFDVRSLRERKKSLQSDIHSLNKTRDKIEREREKLRETIKNENGRINELLAGVSKNESLLESLQEKRSKTAEGLDAAEIKKAELTSKIDTLIETFRERYNVSLELYEPEGRVNREELLKKRAEIRGKIDALGQVNLLAVEEFNEVKKRYGYLTEQRQDLEKAKKDLHDIVADTLASSKDLFMESFTRIKTNFNSIFQRLFNGGRTDLFLTNEANIFETGIEIMACPPGKSLKKRSLLSGGEKSLTAVSLLFSIFMVKPSPFCLLDEVDHDLDEENVIRFLKLLKEFTDTTQFVIITHNRRTIEFADVIYGITSEQAGVSKVVSLEMVQNAVE